MIQTYFRDGCDWGVTIRYAYEPTLLGTAGALHNFADFLDETFVLVYGDVLTNLPLDRLLEVHQIHLTRQRSTLMTIALYRVPNPTQCGIVAVDEEGRILRFVEKPAPEDVFSDLASAGIFIVEPNVMDLIPVGQFVDFGFHVIPEALRQGYPIYGWPVPPDTYLIDIGTPEKYAQAQQEWPHIQEERVL